VGTVGVAVALSSAGFIPLQGISPLAALLQSSRTQSFTYSFLQNFLPATVNKLCNLKCGARITTRADIQI
jgi:hypothetical protein